jgi:hypothetical protein
MRFPTEITFFNAVEHPDPGYTLCFARVHKWHACGVGYPPLKTSSVATDPDVRKGMKTQDLAQLLLKELKNK